MSAHDVPEQQLESAHGGQDALAHVPDATRDLYRAQMESGIGFYDDEESLDKALELSRMFEVQKEKSVKYGTEIVGQDKSMEEKVQQGDRELDFKIAWQTAAQTFQPLAEEMAAEEELRVQRQKQSAIDAWYRRKGELECKLACLEDSGESVAKEKIEELRQLLKDHEKTNQFPEVEAKEAEAKEAEAKKEGGKEGVAVVIGGFGGVTAWTADSPFSNKVPEMVAPEMVAEEEDEEEEDEEEEDEEEEDEEEEDETPDEKRRKLADAALKRLCA